MTIDVTGYENVPTVGAQVTAFYYDGYLLRATRSDGKLLATTWAPAYRWLHGLAGIALIGAAGLAVVHRLRTSPRRSQPILTWLIPYDGAA